MTNIDPSITTSQAVPDNGPVNAPLPRGSVTLSLSVQKQFQSNWGWAAIAASTARFYNPTHTATQCSLANYAFAQTTCCVNGASSLCNQPYSLEQALRHVDHLNMSIQGALSAAQIIQEIDARRPLIALIQWNGGGSHYVMIHGYNTDTTVPGSVAPSTTISIADPWYGDTVIALADFPARYKTGGTWSKSYTTR